MISQIIENNLNFIYWENFIHLRVYELWFPALFFIIVFLWFCILLGKLFIRHVNYLSGAEDLILNFAFGSACTSLMLAILLLSHELTKKNVLGIFFVIVLVSFVSKEKTKPFFAALKTFHLAAREEKWLFLLFFLNSFPAALPPYRYDEMSYHLPYAKQWIDHYALTLDPSMRFPLYTFNFHMLQTLGLMFDSVAFVHLLSWLCGSMASLGVVVFLRRLKVSGPIAYCAALGFYLSPLVQRYLTVGYLDIPFMAYMLLAVYSVYFSRQGDKTRFFYIPSALICGMCVGIKITGIFYIPLFLGLGIISQNPKRYFWFALTFLSFGCLWYLRNFFIDHDPIPPIINMLRHKTDLFWTPEDYRAIATSVKLKHSNGIWFFLTLPIQLLTSTENGPLRDWPLQGFVLFIPLTLCMLPSLLRKRQADPVLALWYGIAVWVASSCLIRYATFAALAAVSAGFFLNFFGKRKMVATVTAAFLLVGPNINALRYFKNNFNRPVPVDGKSYKLFYSYLGLPAIELIGKLKTFGITEGAIYTFGYTHLKYYYNLQGFQVVGDVVNRFRYADFKKSLMRGNVYPFLKKAQVNAVVINKKTLEDFHLSEKQISNRFKKEPRLALVYDDGHSMVYKQVD